MTRSLAGAITPELQRHTVAAIEKLRRQADGYLRVASFLMANPDLPSVPRAHENGADVCVSSQPDPRASVELWMHRAIEAGATVEPYGGIRMAGVRLRFGAAYVRVFADAHKLGERTEEVVQVVHRPDIDIPEHALRPSAVVSA